MSEQPLRVAVDARCLNTEHLRGMGVETSGPPPFGPKDRSAFLQALDRAVVIAKRAPR